MNADFNSMLPGRHERAVFVGMTGCGKTTLSYYIIYAYTHKIKNPYVVCYDPNESLKDWKGYAIYTRLSDVVKSKQEKIIYRPNINELDDPEAWDQFFKFVYLRKNTTLYVDEVYACTDNQEIPFYFKACLTRGRGRGISTFSSTQRPKAIPTTVMSEAENKYIFYLQMDADRKRVYECTGITPDTIRALPKRNFIYANLDRVTKPMTLKLG